ncbi:MAG: ABC-type Fe3+-hydroxamate transport system substrate-binding protein [Shewanella psychromarinicola]|jgi:ABC-type Fe3+-hydroxamate transport system substrate-binding protein|tara:strand:- start:149477 stop:149869 length:393 start_codon:yes stop_codon:yes gene_type:complete
MHKNKLTMLLVSALLTAGMSASAMAEETLTASNQNAPISMQAQQLATAIQAANGDVELIKQALKAAVAAGMNPDEILAIALANGVDPAIVSEAVEDTQTAGGGGFGAAPAPAGPGFGGGSGGGAGTISSN